MISVEEEIEGKNILNKLRRVNSELWWVDMVKKMVVVCT